jgi:hypothetical protein
MPLILKISAKNVNSKMNAGLNLKIHSTLASTILSIVYNGKCLLSVAAFGKQKFK